MINYIKRITEIGNALSLEDLTPKLMEMIVDEARAFSNADGGTLYIKSPDEKYLRFEIVQNKSLNIRMGGTCGKITWPEIKLINDDGAENHSNVSAHVALTGETINISDVYETEGSDFSGTRDFDKKTNYRSKSMLVLPLKDHENEIIGVLQLINAQDYTDNSAIPFSSESQAITQSLAYLAAVVMTKNRLLKGLENLFNAFILTIGKAIDAKSPYTGGHIKRVADLTMEIAERINKTKNGPFSNVSLSKEELNELRVAAWMHDIGKITTPEYVVDKAVKLETIYDRINEIQTRFELFKREAEIKFLKKKLELVEAGNLDKIAKCKKEYEDKLKKIDDDLAFLTRINRGGESMSDESIQRVKDIAAQDTWEKDGKYVPLLSDNEVYNLTIKKGTLTDEERKRVQEHVRLTEVMLNELPFPKKLKNVPKYASAHHETLIGTGYPHGLKSYEIPLQARIIAFADIFEALSASDRPYSEDKKASEIKKIIDCMIKDKRIDNNVADLFFNEDIYQKYMKENYKPDQIDLLIDS